MPQTHLSEEFIWGRVRLDEVVRGPSNSVSTVMQLSCKHWLGIGHLSCICSCTLNLRLDNDYDLRMLFELKQRSISYGFLKNIKIEFSITDQPKRLMKGFSEYILKP